MIIGFDGSYSGDATAIVAVTIGDHPHLDVVQVWERRESDPEDWTVPVGAVEEAIRAACKRWKVREIVADPYRFARTLEALAADKLPIVEYPQSPERMVPATQRFYEAVMSQALTHSGDPRLVRHVRNAVLKAGPRGLRLSKDAKSSPRKIDLAVCAVMALDRAQQPSRPVPRVINLRDYL